MLSQLETSQLRSRCCLNTLASLINSVKTQSLWAPGYGGQTATTSLARWDGALFHHGDVPPGQSCLSQPSFLGCSYGLDLVSAFNTRLLARTLIWPSVHMFCPHSASGVPCAAQIQLATYFVKGLNSESTCPTSPFPIQAFTEQLQWDLISWNSSLYTSLRGKKSILGTLSGSPAGAR